MVTWLKSFEAMTEGFKYISKDDFASQYFGVEIGKLPPDFPPIFGLLKPELLRAKEEGFKVVMAKVHSTDVPALTTLLRCGGKRYGVLETLEMFPTDVSKGDLLVAIELVADGIESELVNIVRNPQDIEQIGTIAETAFTLTHFYNDPRLSRYGWRNFYRQWAINDSSDPKRGAQTILARDKEGAVVGFANIRVFDNEETKYGRLRQGMFDLTAVREDRRAVIGGRGGEGIGRLLAQEVALWMAKNTEFATVGTETDNYPGYAAYYGAGFRPTEDNRQDSFHIWLDNPQLNS